MKRQARDLATLGAAAMATGDLLKLAGVRDDERPTAEHALALVGCARDAAIRSLRCGPRLLAALELGRRAWMLPSPAGRRVRGPVDVAAICAPRFTGEDAALAIALDRRLTVARIAATELDPVRLLHLTLSAGVTRLAVGIHRRGGPAVPTNDDAKLAERLTHCFSLVDVMLLDLVILGDDGFSSFARLGLLPAERRDPRYR